MNGPRADWFSSGFFWRNSLKSRGRRCNFFNYSEKTDDPRTFQESIWYHKIRWLQIISVFIFFFSEAISKLCMSSTQFWSHSFLFLLENPLNTWWIWMPENCCQNPHCTICQDSDWEFSMDSQTWIRKLICLVCLANIHFFFLSTGNMGCQVSKRGIKN